VRINDGQGADSLNSGLSLGPWLPFFGRPRGRLAAAGAPASSAARLPAEAAAAAGTRAEEEPPASAGWAAACARAASFFCAAFRFASSISSLVGARPSLRVSFSTILPMLSGAGGHAGGDICSLVAMAGYPPGLEFRGAHLSPRNDPVTVRPGRRGVRSHGHGGLAAAAAQLPREANPLWPCGTPGRDGAEAAAKAAA
jgi:hypothetical protein